MTLQDKRIWNKAVDATLKELMMYNGIIPDDNERLLLKTLLAHKIKKKIKEPKVQVCDARKAPMKNKNPATKKK